MRETSHILLGAALLLIAFAVTAQAAPTRDEQRLLQVIEAACRPPAGDFSQVPPWNAGGMGDGYRYTLAFLSYGLASIAHGHPGGRLHYRELFARLIAKMEHPAALAYWKRAGYRGDGLSRDNVMYRGHLCLMYGLAVDRLGLVAYAERFKRLARALRLEMRAAPTRGVCCEPDQLFVQCNSVTLLAFRLHDRLHRTDYLAAGKPFLAWAHRTIGVEGTRLFRDDYRPRSGRSTLARTGYANAWTIAFLGAIPAYEREARGIYRDWRRIYPRSGELFGLVRGEPPGVELPREQALASAVAATFFGLLAAREMGDRPLARRLWVTMGLAYSMARPLGRLSGKPKSARLLKTLALMSRSFRGWRTILGQ